MTWFDTGYQYKKAITIDHTKVSGSSDLSSFPVLVSMTDADLATVANGGYVQNSSGFDIIFTNSAEDTKLDHEIERYTASSGLIVMWVRIPTLSHTADTVIYIYFGNSGISTTQENATAVWDANYAAVYHLKETAGTSSSIKDSTSNANHATPFTNIGTSTTGDISTGSGEIDGAQSFDGTGHAITAPNSASLNIGGQNTLTMSAWVKRSASNSTGTIIKHGTGAQGGYVLAIGNSPATTNQIKLTKYGVVDITIGSFPADTNWHYLIGSGNGSGTYADIDGSRSTDGNTQNWNTNTVSLHIGDDDRDLSNNNLLWNGLIDEVRISNIYRSPAWGTTEYNNQSSPSTFYSVGALTGQGNAPLNLVDTAISTTTLALASNITDANTATTTESTVLVSSYSADESVASVSSPSVQSSIASSASSTVLETLSVLASLGLVDASQVGEIVAIAPAIVIVDLATSTDSISFTVATIVTVYAIGYGRDGYAVGEGA